MDHDAFDGPAGAFSRRRFLASAAAAGAATAQLAAPALGADTPAGRRSEVCLFSKCFQPRTVPQLGEVLAGLGYKSVGDLTVRGGGHVLPERVEDDLPKARETLAAAGIRIAMITTEITAADQKHAAATIATAGRLGIRYLKLGYYPYRDPRAIAQTFADAKAKLRGLVPLLKEHGVHAGFHNHSGVQVGALLWDEWELIRDLDPRWVGSFIDPCHATCEGGLGGWQIGMNLLGPRITMLAVKDFTWRKEKDAWKQGMVPLGDGNVRWDKALDILKANGFAGPISLHVEHMPRVPAGSDEEKKVIEAVRKDTDVLRALLTKAGIETV